MRRAVLTVVLIVLFASPVLARAPIFLWTSPFLGEMTMPNALCRHEALFCAFVASERYDVQIAYGWSSGTMGVGEAHVQAQAKVGQSWVWLVMKEDECYFGSQDTFDNSIGKNQPFLIEQLLTLPHYVASMHVWAEAERVEWTMNQEEGK